MGPQFLLACRRADFKVQAISNASESPPVLIDFVGHLFGKSNLLGRASHNHELLGWNLLNPSNLPNGAHQI
ncbi:MAG: hypothetical protein WBF25_01260, partial [Terriglobales bacterium]